MVLAAILGLASTAALSYLFSMLLINVIPFGTNYSEVYSLANFLTFVVGALVGMQTNQEISERLRTYVEWFGLSAFLIGIGSFFYKFASMFNV